MHREGHEGAVCRCDNRPQDTRPYRLSPPAVGLCPHIAGPAFSSIFWEQNDCVTNARALLLILIHEVRGRGILGTSGVGGLGSSAPQPCVGCSGTSPRPSPSSCA